MDVAVIIPTYNRHETLKRTVELLAHNLIGNFEVIVGDDSNDEEHVKKNMDWASRLSLITLVQSDRAGLNANLNKLIGVARDRGAKAIFQLDDDHHLVRPMHLNFYLDDLFDSHYNIGWIRFFLGQSKDYKNLHTYYKFAAANLGPYWYIDPESPELYIASNRPHLKRADFHDYYGPYPEGLTLGKGEEAWCHKYKNERKKFEWGEAPWVVIPMFGLEFHQWDHVGNSWQKAGL